MSGGKSDPPQNVSYETKAGDTNPAPLFSGASPELIKPTWGDLMMAAESEFNRADNWRRILLVDLADEKLTIPGAETLRSAIRLHAKQAANFASMMRMIDRMRDPYIAERLRQLAEADAAPDAGADDDMIEADT